MYSAKSDSTKADSLTPDGLSRFYYLDNFQHVLRHVLRHYADLLSDEERTFGQRFLALEQAHQALLVRLYSRKGPIFRSDKLNYAEIQSLDSVLEDLGQAGWVRRNPTDLAPEILAGKLTRKEIQDWFGVPASATKDKLLQALPDQASALTARLPFDFIEPTHPQTVQIYLDLFFGNRYQDLSTFVVSQLGHVKYPEYPLDQAARFFQSRDDLELFQQLASLREQFERLEALADAAVPLQALAKTIPPLAQGHPLHRRADRLRNLIARQLERLGDTSQALTLYQLTRLPPARERRARILFNDACWLDCYHLCLEMQRNPLDESEAYFADRQLPRCLRKLGITSKNTGKPFSPLTHQITLIQEPSASIEQQVAAHLTQNGATAFHVENWLFNALFGLLFWDCIFLPVRGAFMHPFQMQPHDLYHPEFHERRQDSLNHTLEDVAKDPNLDQRIQTLWQRHFGTANPFVGWMEGGDVLLRQATLTVPRAHLLLIFKRLLSDLRYYSSGFPDLICFTAEGGYELIEIKGPGDQLRANQTAWLNYFESAGIPASVLRVEWA